MKISTLIPSVALGSILALSVSPVAAFANSGAAGANPGMDSLDVAITDQAPPKGYIVADTNIIEMIAASEQHSKLTYGLGKTGLASDLALDGPYTVFAPVDSAFEGLSSEKTAMLMTGDNTAPLTSLLKTHVVTGKWDHFALKTEIEAAENGQYALTALSGETLTAQLVDDNIAITDGLGNIASITAMDLKQNNGIVHVIDTVLTPQSSL